MAAGVPVVASDIAGYRGVVENGVHGVLVEPRNSEALAKAVIDLLREPQRRAQLGAAGRSKAEMYDWSHVARRVLGFYAEAGAARQNRSSYV